jgi:uncharacterized protein
LKLFPKEQVVGIFRGFSQGGLEFHADLILPYRSDFQSSPMHGQFLLVQLEHEDEAVLGRVTSISAQGRLASGSGEDYGIRAVAEDRPIPEDLREQYLKYEVNIRVLGVLRVGNDGNTEFAASHRRLPHVGSKVAFLSEEILKEVAGHNLKGPEIGWFAMGEFVYADDDKRLKVLPWMRVWKPKVIPKFDVTTLVSRRTFVFARAGFGKSNLVKLLFSNLYFTTPTVEKRGGFRKPIGSVIFDRDGEYFWPDDKGRPGLCDVEFLKNKIVVFTSREAPSKYYQSFVAGNIRLDIRRLRPSDVISIALSPEKQDQQNVRKLKGLNDNAWKELVDEIAENGNFADPVRISQLLGLNYPEQEAEMVAARANMTTIVRMLHDPGSQMMDMLILALKEGKLCVVDVSQIRGSSALVLSGLILQKIFDHNQEEFTKARPETIPTIAVIEEAQSVLSETAASTEGPYVTWVKEGRKYDLGAVLITQQPGSISWQILSQGDNWFIFHLLSGGDLTQLRRANSHFSADILSSLLNEPIVGNGIYWSSAAGKPYPIPIRVLSFEDMYSALDPRYERSGEETYARELRSKFEKVASEIVSATAHKDKEGGGPSAQPSLESEPADMLSGYNELVLQALAKDENFLQMLRNNGMPWRGVVQKIEQTLPAIIDDQEKNHLAYDLASVVISKFLGEENKNWKSERRPSKSKPGSFTTWVVPLK